MSGTPGQNTHCSTITVHYPLHPLYGQTLEVVWRPRRRDGAVTVEEPTGRRLKIPLWMLSPAAPQASLSTQALVSVRALESLVELVDQLLPDGGYARQQVRGRASADRLAAIKALEESE